MPRLGRAPLNHRQSSGWIMLRVLQHMPSAVFLPLEDMPLPESCAFRLRRVAVWGQS